MAEGEDAYREQCRAIVAKARDLGDPKMTRVAIQACLVIPDALEDQTVLVDLARQVAAAMPDPPIFSKKVLAGALLRGGQIDEALALLHEIEAAEPAGPYFRLAIACHAAGDEEQAAAWLKTGDQWTEQTRETGVVSGWRPSLVSQLQQQEAHQLLRIPAGGKPQTG